MCRVTSESPMLAGRLPPRGRPRAGRRARLGEEEPPGGRGRHRRQPRDRAAVQDPPAGAAGARPDVDDPVGASYDVHVVLHHEQGVARGLEAVEHGEQRLGVGGVQPGRRLVQHVDHAEQPRTQGGGQPQPLQLAAGERRRRPAHAEVAQPELEQHLDPRDQVGGDGRGHVAGPVLRRATGRTRGGAQHLGQPGQRQPGEVGDVVSGEGDRERLRAQPVTGADRAGHGLHELQHPLAHGGAAGVRQGVQHVPPGAHVLPLVGALDAARLALGVDGDHRLLVGEQDPVAVGLVQLAPRAVDVVAEGGQDVAQVLAEPGTRPGGDRPLADAERGVRDHRLLGGQVHPPEPVALRARPGDGVGGEGVGVQPPRARRVGPRAGVQHPQRVRQRRHGADGGPGGRRPAPLLQCHRRRQAGDRLHLRGAHLLDEPAGVRRDGLHVAALRLGVEGAEGQGGLARPGHAGEHGERVPRDVHVDRAQVVHARTPHADETVEVGLRQVGQRGSPPGVAGPR